MTEREWGKRGRPKSLRELVNRWRRELADECYAAVADRGPQPLHDVAIDIGVRYSSLRRVIEMETPKRLELFKSWVWVGNVKCFAWCARLYLPVKPPPRRKKQ